MAGTVTELLNQLAAGTVTLADVAADFRTRQWPPQERATEAQAWDAVDEDPPDPNSWDAVDADSRLTADQYQVLAQARATSQT